MKIIDGVVNMHPKMMYTYVGIDSHKDTHTAVFLDCFFEKLGELTFDNLPSKFPDFLNNALKLQQDGTTLLFGLEDISMYGRTFAVFLKNNGQPFKHVNSLLVARERRTQTSIQKTDTIDAECAARILLSKFGELPDVQPDDRFWMLKTLIMRRNFIVKNNISLKNHLHSLLTQHYPNYRTLFPSFDNKAALAFFLKYPSPSTLEGITESELTSFLRQHRCKFFLTKGKEILETLQDTTVDFQNIRDAAVQSTVRQIQFNIDELQRLDHSLADAFALFETTLTSMTGLGLTSAAQMLAHIGDIRRFSSPAKLARYSGIAPVTYASGKRETQYANQRGNRELNTLFYLLAVRLIATSRSGNMRNAFFHEYYHRKISEGKTKNQAIKCVQRRLVNIIWGMLTHGKKYDNPLLSPKHP